MSGQIAKNSRYAENSIVQAAMSSSNKTDSSKSSINTEAPTTIEDNDINQLTHLILSDLDRGHFLNALELATPSTGNLQQAFSDFRQKYSL
jgi:hypothetical protein